MSRPADFQLPFAAFPSYPGALSAPLRSALPTLAPRVEQGRLPLNQRPDDTAMNVASGSGTGTGRRTSSGGKGTESSSSSRGVAGRASGDETPPSSPDLVILKVEEEAAKVPPQPPVKVPAKRGRKKKPLPEELDAMEDLLDGGEATRKRGKRPEPSAPEKRKLQNRAAQRAFRERKEKHVKDVEDRVVEQDVQLQAFRDIFERLYAENQALRRGEEVPLSHFEVPPPMAKLEAPTLRQDSPAFSTEQPNPQHHSPTDPAFSFRDLDLSAFAVPEAAPNPFSNAIDPSLQPAAVQQLQQQQQYQQHQLGNPPVFKEQEQLGPNFDLQTFEFDFDAPFDDYASVIPLPPLFQDLFTQSYDMDTTPTPFDGEEDDGEACPGDGDDHLPLPDGRIPCDKPQCDFSLISCALPIPWRPPAIGSELKPQDVWVCTQAWAKLCSHPLFGECDVDELCHELRDKTLCSEDGRVVITKKDVCGVFRSIPARARARREMDATA